MGDICLNALPLLLKAETGTVIGRKWTRNEAVDEKLRELPERGTEFHHYSFDALSYAWPCQGGSLPDECAIRGSDLVLAEAPASVVAFAARQGAVQMLVSEGFSVCSARVGMPTRLSRRNKNLAEAIVGRKLPKDVGAFAALAIQGMPLAGDGRQPGGVALILDQWVEHALELNLPTLAAVGIELLGARVRWRHEPGCECDLATRVGDAGRIIGEELAESVSVRDVGGEQQSVPSRCLTVHASRTMLVRYLASLNGGNERTIGDALYEATTGFARTDVRWKNLEKTSERLFANLEVFDGVSAKLGKPLVVRRGATLMTEGPVVLASVSEGDLNFQYGTPKLERHAGRGLGVYGPYDQGQERHDVLKAVVVAPEEFVAEAKKLKNILIQGLAKFKGMQRRYRLRGFECELQSFSGTTRSSYENAVATAARGGFDIVFFVTKQDFRYAPRGQNPYLAAKAVLASVGVASQAVTVEVLHQPETSLQWSSDSVALAAYTKIGNIPYVLHDPLGGRELVLGIGRSDVYDYEKGGRRQTFGSAVAVRQDGDFLFAGSTTAINDDESYQAHLKRLLADSIARYASEQGGDPDRLVIYLFKRPGRQELGAIYEAIGDRDIGFALLHVNRDSPLWVVERSSSRIIPPPRGTTIALSELDRLLITGDPKKPVASHPLRLTLHPKSTYTDMTRLVQQAAGFTKTSYRGFMQSNEPSPILFGRLLAEKVEQLVPYGFNPASAAGPLGDRPWFI